MASTFKSSGGSSEDIIFSISYTKSSSILVQSILCWKIKLYVFTSLMRLIALSSVLRWVFLRGRWRGRSCLNRGWRCIGLFLWGLYFHALARSSPALGWAFHSSSKGLWVISDAGSTCSRTLPYLRWTTPTPEERELFYPMLLFTTFATNKGPCMFEISCPRVAGSPQFFDPSELQPDWTNLAHAQFINFLIRSEPFLSKKPSRFHYCLF